MCQVRARAGRVRCPRTALHLAKQPPPIPANTYSLQELLLREAEALIRLPHPKVVQCQ